MPDAGVVLALKALAAFLMGSIPFAVLAMMGSGVDIRSVGSGNPGFNNVLRVNKPRAFLCLAGDLGKGILAILLLTRATDPVGVRWTIAFAVMLGHCYSPWLRFNGGKGVATSSGVMLVLYPWLALPCAITYVVGRVVGKKMGWRESGALASLGGWVLFVVLLLVTEGERPALYAAIMLAIVTWRHKDNLHRLFQPAQA